MLRSGKIKQISFEEGINEEEFINLNVLSLLIQENSIVWNFLRKFAYGDNMKIDYATNLNFFKFSEAENSANYIFELSKDAINILTNMFINYGKSKSQSSNNNSIASNNQRIYNKKYTGIYFWFFNIKNYFLLEKNLENFYISETEWNKIFYPYIRTNNFSNYLSLFTNNYSREQTLSYEEWILFWQSLVRVNYELAYEAFLYVGNHISINSFFKFIPKKKIDFYQPIKFKAIKICVLAESNESFVN